MSSLSFSIVIIIYLLVILCISYFTGRKADNEAFFIGNRKSRWYVVAFAMIGTSISGVTFVSVPGWVRDSHFSYMQMVLGFLLGYFVIANILMPLYYRLNLTSIYTYLDQRFGKWTYKTGSSLFLLSRTLGAAVRLYLMAMVLQLTVFDSWHVPFVLTVAVTILLIWLYTFKGGIRTILYTDMLQGFFMLLALCLTTILLGKEMGLGFKGIVHTIASSDLSRIFYFDDFKATENFVKQFLSGAFITIVMTGLDQDMMQKNLSCRNIKDAKKNMYSFSLTLIPINLLFLSLGALLYIYAAQKGIELPSRSDEVFPMIATKGYLPAIVAFFFFIGLIAASYSAADSALTALTTSFTVDIMGVTNKTEVEVKKLRYKVHFLISVVMFLVIIVFRLLNNASVISAVYTIAGYTYGPLLGLFSFGLFTKLKLKDKLVPIVCFLSPVICLILDKYSDKLIHGYKIGFELLILNGLITFIGLLLISRRDT
jgi:SSS family solute:Na+ symporter